MMDDYMKDWISVDRFQWLGMANKLILPHVVDEEAWDWDNLK